MGGKPRATENFHIVKAETIEILHVPDKCRCPQLCSSYFIITSFLESQEVCICYFKNINCATSYLLAFYILALYVCNAKLIIDCHILEN